MEKPPGTEAGLWSQPMMNQNNHVSEFGDEPFPCDSHSLEVTATHGQTP